MEKEIFETLEKQIGSFFRKLSLGYVLKENEVVLDTAIKERNYKSHRQYWYNKRLKLEFYIIITIYLDSNSKSLIIPKVRKYEKTSNCKVELVNFMNIEEYYRKQKNMPIQRLEDYEGNSIEEKIQSFFNWFEENIDERLINVLKGKDWIDTPWDWGGYK